MSALLILIGVAVFGAVLGSILDTGTVHRTLDKMSKVSGKTQFPRSITVLLLMAQFSELVKSIQHLTIGHGVALVLFVVLFVAHKAGADNNVRQLH